MAIDKKVEQRPLGSQVSIWTSICWRSLACLDANAQFALTGFITGVPSGCPFYSVLEAASNASIFLKQLSDWHVLCVPTGPYHLSARSWLHGYGKLSLLLIGLADQHRYTQNAEHRLAVCSVQCTQQQPMH